VGGLAHYLEAKGIATTQISLIREHTEKICPPRALWVPFELGRPLGVPNDPVFQRRILLAVLNLLAAPEGPVLMDFPGEASPIVGEESHEAAVWACPVHFASSAANETDLDKMILAFRLEVAELMPWYDKGFQHRGRTAVGDFDPQSAAVLFIDFAQGHTPKLPDENQSLSVALRLAAHDLKCFYFEAVIARQGSPTPDSSTFNHWFWQETAAGKMLKVIREKCLAETDTSLRLIGTLLLVPMTEKSD
jgi:hypothetical protein